MASESRDPPPTKQLPVGQDISSEVTEGLEEPSHGGREHDKHTHGDAHGDKEHSQSGRHDHVNDGEKHRDLLGWPRRLGLLHGHSHSVNTDLELETSERGIWAVKISLALLGLTAVFQVFVVLASGSIALLADTIHNITDALTALPLWLAFVLSRRAVSRRFTYGHGRAEDIAGLVVVIFILVSALVAGYESLLRIRDPRPLDHIEWVMAAAVVGFLGNEVVASFRMRVGREINSAALIADGHHARVDGLTSLAVLAGALGVLAGWPAADPIVGALITLAILFILKDASLMVGLRLLDGVEPGLRNKIDESLTEAIAGEGDVRGTNGLRIRWLGHKLQLEFNLVVDEDLSTGESHALSLRVHHALLHTHPQLSSVMIHIDPDGPDYVDAHDLTAHHTRPKNSSDSKHHS